MASRGLPAAPVAPHKNNALAGSFSSLLNQISNRIHRSTQAFNGAAGVTFVNRIRVVTTDGLPRVRSDATIGEHTRRAMAQTVKTQGGSLMSPTLLSSRNLSANPDTLHDLLELRRKPVASAWFASLEFWKDGRSSYSFGLALEPLNKTARQRGFVFEPTLLRGNRRQVRWLPVK